MSGRLLLALICLFLETGQVSEAQSFGAPSLHISHPAEGQVLSSRTFPLLYVLGGDTAGAGLDHVHWQLDDGPKPTAPDLSGVDEVTVEADGEYRLTVWMADKDHGVIGEKAVHHIKVVTFGAQILAPSEAERLSSSSIDIHYTLFGAQPQDATGVTAVIDGGSSASDPDGDGTITFHGVANGEHVVRVFVTDEAGKRLSVSSERNIVVESDLTVENLQLAKKLARAVQRSTEGGRAKSLVKLRKLLGSMADGGEFAAGAPDVSKASLSRASRVLQAVMQRSADPKSLLSYLSRLGRKAGIR